MPDVPLLDHFGRSGGMSKQAEVRVAGSPGSWFFKDKAAGKLHARICGDCGHTELWTSNSGALDEKYARARSAAGEAREAADVEPS